MGSSGYSLGTAESEQGWSACGGAKSSELQIWAGLGLLAPPAWVLALEWRGSACGSTPGGYFSRISATRLEDGALIYRAPTMCQIAGLCRNLI